MATIPLFDGSTAAGTATDIKQAVLVIMKDYLLGNCKTSQILQFFLLFRKKFHRNRVLITRDLREDGKARIS